MDKQILEAMNKALKKADDEYSKASYLSECGSNAGLRQINANKAEWLHWVCYLAGYGLERMRADEEQTERADKIKCDECAVSAESTKLIKEKDKLIKELCQKNDDITAQLSSLQLTYDCEVEHCKALANKAKIDYFTEVLKLAHEHCWLDGTVLVTPVEYLDKSLLELIKE